ncbi:MAG: carbohydrate kinase [Anaerolineae bacterium]|nr:carbohydrate kinase [Anaerolineae bacterium]
MSVALIVGLGGSTVDILTLAEDFPAEGGVYYPREITMQGGGPVATALVAAARLGCQTAMIDRIGDDWVGAHILREFAAAGVDCSGVQVSPGHRSCVSSILVRAGDGQRAILHQKSDAPDLLPDDLPYDLLAQAGILHLNGHHPQACLAAARFCRERGIPVAFDGGEYAGQRPVMAELVPLTEICIVARQFALDFSGESDLAAAGEMLLAQGAGVVGITDGIHGSWFWLRGGESFHQPAFRMETVVDTTGCGDAFHGAFLAGWVRGLPPRACARLGSAVAALKTRQLGGRAALPGWGEVEGMVNECSMPGLS